jgi:hypothetical protein
LIDPTQAAPSDRDATMKEAVKKDTQAFNMNLREIGSELTNILNSMKALKAGGISSDLLDRDDAFSKLQVAMAKVNDKIAVSLGSVHDSRR